jgi:hypothetical protein
VRDLIALIDILGADNFDDDTLRLLERHVRRGRGEGEMLSEDERGHLRHALERFMVRRTMAMLNAAIARDPDAYRDRQGKRCRYPTQRARTYDCTEPERDRGIVTQIRAEAESLRGLVYLGTTVAPFRPDEERSWSRKSPEGELDLRLTMARHLAVYQVMSCLRSSRAALIEHLYGTERARREFALMGPVKATDSGDYIGKVRALAGRVPENAFPIPLPTWLSDPEEHARACADEAATCERIAALARSLSEAREEAKAEMLLGLLQQHVVSCAPYNFPDRYAGVDAHRQSARSPVCVLRSVLSRPHCPR